MGSLARLKFTRLSPRRNPGQNQRINQYLRVLGRVKDTEDHLNSHEHS